MVRDSNLNETYQVNKSIEQNKTSNPFGMLVLSE